MTSLAFAPVSMYPPQAQPQPSREADDDAAALPPLQYGRGGLDAKKALWVLTLSALAARLALVLLLHQWTDATAMEHASLAQSLLQGNGFAFNESGGYTQFGRYEQSSVQSPPYPLLLAGLYWHYGVRSESAHLAAEVLNCFAGAATVPLAFLMVRNLRGRPTVALVTAALVAVWPTQLLAAAYVQAICLITLCTLGVVVLWYRSIDTGRLLPWVGFGLVGCVAALTEPVLLPAMALAGVMVLLHPPLDWPTRLRNGAVLFACAVVVIGPWTYRNYVVHGAFMPIKSTFWVNVWKGNNPHSAGTDRPALTDERLADYQTHDNDNVRQYSFLTNAQREELNGKTAVEREALWKKYATTFIRGNPGRYAELCGIRLAKTLWWEWDNPKGHQALYAYPISRAVLLLGSLLGLCIAVSRRWRMAWPAVIVGSSLLTYTLTITAARFALPLEPFQLALSALVVVWAWDRFFGETRRPPIVRNFARFNDGREDVLA